MTAHLFANLVFLCVFAVILIWMTSSDDDDMDGMV